MAYVRLNAASSISGSVHSTIVAVDRVGRSTAIPSSGIRLLNSTLAALPTLMAEDSRPTYQATCDSLSEAWPPVVPGHSNCSDVAYVWTICARGSSHSTAACPLDAEAILPVCKAGAGLLDPAVCATAMNLAMTPGIAYTTTIEASECGGPRHIVQSGTVVCDLTPPETSQIEADPSPLICSALAVAAVCASPSEPCSYDPGCLDIPNDVHGGLGCIAPGGDDSSIQDWGCRFCGFGPFPACPDLPGKKSRPVIPTLAPLLAADDSSPHPIAMRATAVPSTVLVSWDGVFDEAQSYLTQYAVCLSPLPIRCDQPSSWQTYGPDVISAQVTVDEALVGTSAAQLVAVVKASNAAGLTSATVTSDSLTLDRIAPTLTGLMVVSSSGELDPEGGVQSGGGSDGRPCELSSARRLGVSWQLGALGAQGSWADVDRVEVQAVAAQCDGDLKTIWTEGICTEGHSLLDNPQGGALIVDGAGTKADLLTDAAKGPIDGEWIRLKATASDVAGLASTTAVLNCRYDSTPPSAGQLTVTPKRGAMLNAPSGNLFASMRSEATAGSGNTPLQLCWSGFVDAHSGITLVEHAISDASTPSLATVDADGTNGRGAAVEVDAALVSAASGVGSGDGCREVDATVSFTIQVTLPPVMES